MPGVFQEEVDEFVQKNAPQFAVVCQDGRHLNDGLGFRVQDLLTGLGFRAEGSRV